MNISEIFYQETEYLLKLVPYGRAWDLSASINRIEVAVAKHAGQSYTSGFADGLEAECPKELRRVIIDDLNKCVGDLSDRLVDANKTIAELEAQLKNQSYCIICGQTLNQEEK